MSRLCVPAARRPSAPQQSRSELLTLVGQAALVVAVFGAALAWFAASPDSPYAALPEVTFARKLAVGIFWKARPAAPRRLASAARRSPATASSPNAGPRRANAHSTPLPTRAPRRHTQVADGIYNPLHLACVTAINLLLAALAYVLPVVETLPEAVLLAVTELGGLLLDCALVVAAALKAVTLKAVYVAVLLLDACVGALAALLTDTDAALRTLYEWFMSRDPGGLLLSLLLARPFTAPAELLLQATKVSIQWTMAAVETLAALAYATPAALGVALIPAAYVVHAVWRRARRVVIAEPPLTFTLEELDAKVAQLTPLYVPPLPILEKQIENEIVGFVNAVGSLEPLRVPPLPNAELSASNDAVGASNLTAAQRVDAVVDRAPLDTSYSITSSTVVTMQTPDAGYDGLAAVRASVGAFERTVAGLPPLADAQRAADASEEAAAAALALSAAEAALAEAEAAFYAIDGPISATTTTVTSMSQKGVPVGGTLKRTVDAAAALAGAAEATYVPAQEAPDASATVARKPRTVAPLVAPVEVAVPEGDAGNGPARSSVLKEALIRGVAASLGVAGAVERAASGTQAIRGKPGARDDDRRA